jgi:hypothetical protein
VLLLIARTDDVIPPSDVPRLSTRLSSAVKITVRVVVQCGEDHRPRGHVDSKPPFPGAETGGLRLPPLLLLIDGFEVVNRDVSVWRVAEVPREEARLVDENVAEPPRALNMPQTPENPSAQPCDRASPDGPQRQ